MARLRSSDALRARPSGWVFAASILAGLAGCAGAKAESPPLEAAQLAQATASTQAQTPTPARAVKVFFVKGEQFAPRIRTVPPGQDAATVAMQSLLAGPTTSERATGIDTTLPRKTNLVALKIRSGTATVELSRARTPSTGFDVSLRPARAAQVVYTLTAITGIEQVLIRVNGVNRATFVGSKLAVRGALDTHDLSKPIALPKKPSVVPKGPAPADPRGVQRRLASLRFLPAEAVTGAWNERTRHAVIAFQAWQRLARDGIVGPHTLAAFENAPEPKPTRTLRGRHVEVYREKGVTLLVENGKLVRALHSSSGTQGYETPAGTYTVFRKERNSWSVPYQVWLPYASYFNGGIAFHAYPQVPARPASHGCVRLPVAEAPFAYSFMAIGTPVSVY